MSADTRVDQRTLEDETTEVVPASEVSWDVETDVLVAGAGGCGLVATLAASENPDLRVTLLEKTGEPGGNTELSTGMIPAAGTRFQRAAGIAEAPNDMAQDILEKNDYEADEDIVQHLCEESRALVHWLVDEWDVSLHFVDDFRYPKQSEFRMHAPPGRKGANLVGELVDRVDAQPNAELLTNTPIRQLVAEDGAVTGVIAGKRHREAIKARKVVLATNGFAGNKRMIDEWCPEIEDALYFGADGNTGDGIRMGAELGGDLACMDAYQGFASVIQGVGIHSTYAAIMKGGIMINADGERFGDESRGYSAFAVDVLRQPNGVAYKLFDQEIFDELAGQFDDFDEAVELDGYERGESVEALADRFEFDAETARETLETYNEAAASGGPDTTGRTDGLKPLSPPLYGAEVTGALFHTQGGLVVDEHGQVLREDDSVVENLYAGGGTAVGISGHGAGGYLSGNGLTTALGFGKLAGDHAREALSNE
ncbi:FAD-dependent oxidoreductase [Natronomonas marina]|uniref:FAD-dependent oxidoreductase n=1 Tax=Natronomonas marina TaxID=2961939 RepID=UPI0020C9EE81|nr:FAD-dependent oxidoreductase [Natronomonas marina]